MPGSQSQPQAGPSIVAPATRDLDALAVALSGWLAAKRPDAGAPGIDNLRYPLGAGMSHETILFDAVWRGGGEPRRRGLVVRIKPSGATVYQDDMFEPQYRLMKLMHDRGAVRVAEPLWFEPDPALLGAPFFIMAKVTGRVAVSYPPYSRQGWLVDDATPDQRRMMWHDAVTQLALIQHVPPADAAFLTLPGGEDGFAQEAGRWRRYMDWIDAAGALTGLRGAFDTLMERAPAERPDGIVWGDARLGNMMIGADWQVAAVMDWEQPSLGGALHDLGWWLLSDENATTAQGLAPLPGMGTREETIALWETVSGKSAAGIAWYRAFAIFKQECLFTRMSQTRDMPGKATPFVAGSRTRTALDQVT